MSTIYFEYKGSRHPIDLVRTHAPTAVAKLLESLPTTIDIHCAKIAGKHIFWHAPFVADLEAPQDILGSAPGAFVYWPDRQFLELIYGTLQPEVANVSVLGHVRGDVGWLQALGQEVADRQGHEWICARLAADAGTTAPAARTTQDHDALSELRAARLEAWRGPPEEFDALASRRGMMLPYGPLAMAEGEFRKLHELLWALRSSGAALGGVAKAEAAALLLDAFFARIDGLCGLHRSGRLLKMAALLYRTEARLFSEITEELILYCGRMAAWLDLYIPWKALNEEVLKTIPGLLSGRESAHE